MTVKRSPSKYNATFIFKVLTGLHWASIHEKCTPCFLSDFCSKIKDGPSLPKLVSYFTLKNLTFTRHGYSVIF